MSLWICRSYPTWAAAVLCQGFWRAVKISETGKLRLFRSGDLKISQLANPAVSVKVKGGRATLGEPGNTSHPSSHLKFWGWKLLSQIWGCGNKRTNWSLSIKQLWSIAQPWCLSYKFIHLHVFVICIQVHTSLSGCEDWAFISLNTLESQHCQIIFS